MQNSIALAAPTPLRKELSDEVTTEIIHTYRGWDHFERKHGGPSIIDFDLSNVEGSATFTSREEVLSSLSELHDRIDDTGGEQQFLRARLQGSIAYLQELSGHKLPFSSYLESTLGVKGKPFPAGEVKRARHAVSDALKPYGLELRTEDRKRFESMLLINDPAAIQDGILGSKDVWLDRVRHAGIPVPKHIQLAVKHTEVDAYWSNWISNWSNGEAQKKITLMINFHARKKYDRGRPLVLCLHEVCGHAAQMSIWREQILSGRMNPACGLTVVHAPESVAVEGLAQCVPDLLSDDWEFPPEFTLSRALSYYTLVVLHNAHLMIYEGLPEKEILGYACDQLPFSSRATLKNELHDRKFNPLFRSYLLSYAIGEHTIKGLIEGMSSPQKRRFFFEMYTRPLTPSQLVEVGQSQRIRD